MSLPSREFAPTAIALTKKLVPLTVPVSVPPARGKRVPILVAIVADKSVTTVLILVIASRFVFVSADTATAKLLTLVIIVLLLLILVAKVEDKLVTTVLILVTASRFVFVNAETAVTTVLILVTAAVLTLVNADTPDNTVLMLVTESRFVFVNADTAATTVLILVTAAVLTLVKTDTAAILVLLFPMLVAKAADTVASSALVAKLPPSPIIVLILVIAAALTDVRTDTFATTVLMLVTAPSRFEYSRRFVVVSADTAATSFTVAAVTPEIRRSPVTARAVLTETVPKFWSAETATTPLTGIELDTAPPTVILIPVPASICFIVPPSAEGTLVSPEPSPTKKAALTILLNVATEAETLAAFIVPVTLNAAVNAPSIFKLPPTETLELKSP